MAVKDLSIVGFTQTLPRRVAASATRFEVGEPLHDVYTLSSGLSTNNVFTLVAVDSPVVGTHRFGGVAIKGARPISTGTLIAQTAMCSCPVPQLGRLRGRALTIASVDTDAEILLLIGDTTLIDGADTTGAPDGGELFTIQEVATANTGGLEIVEGNAAKQTLDTLVDARAYRPDIA